MSQQRMPNRRQDKAAERRQTVNRLVMISQFGINMMVPMILCFFGGYWLDKKLGTNYIMIIGFFVGALAGFRNIYLYAVKSMKSSVKKESDEKDSDKIDSKMNEQSDADDSKAER